MKLNVKQKNNFLQLLPKSASTALAIRNSIYLPSTFYRAHQKRILTIQQKAVLVHEKIHLKRQKEIGLLIWFLKYCLNPHFRYQEELLAIEVQFKYLYSKQKSLPINFYAKTLSSWLYLRMVTFRKAKKDLEDIARRSIIE